MDKQILRFRSTQGLLESVRQRMSGQDKTGILPVPGGLLLQSQEWKTGLPALRKEEQTLRTSLASR